MALLYALGSWAYPIVFGQEWKLAGQAAEVLSIYYFFRLISSPIAPVINILREEGRLLTFQILLFVMRVGSLIGAYMWSQDFLDIMLVFSIANAITFAALTQRIFAIIKYKAWQSIFFATTAFAVCLLIAHLAKSAF